MKRAGLLFLGLYCFMSSFPQNIMTPDKLWGDLFKDVQLNHVFPDNKTFVDCTPKFEPKVILAKYAEEKSKPGFDLKKFVVENFNTPQIPNVKVKEGLSINKHIEDLWNVLTRKGDENQKYSSLLPLPATYIVPGGRFREIYYWDSYFTMQGLAVNGRYDLIDNMVNSFKFLIDNYGHIPNGNRNYYLSRSQPPYFAMMVELLHQKEGDQIYRKYFSAMEKEYKFWMADAEKLKTANASRRVVKMPDGSILNRYWDDNNAPRQESYVQDVTTGKNYELKDGKAFVNLRAGAESGWDFSSRWFRDSAHITTIETTDIVPVDLNSLLYDYELTLSKAAEATGSSAKAKMYAAKAEARKASMQKYFWDEKNKFFFDYHLVDKKSTGKWTIAAAMPLFCKWATQDQSEGVQNGIKEKLLRDGGVSTTTFHTGQQWDAPNGWAPLQFITVQGLLNYRHDDLARSIGERWMTLNEKVFKSTGKLLEKYNIENLNLESGGGEYPTQDGFGWSNGVYMKFHYIFRDSKKAM